MVIYPWLIQVYKSLLKDLRLANIFSRGLVRTFFCEDSINQQNFPILFLVDTVMEKNDTGKEMGY